MRKRHSKYTGIVTVENCKMWYVDGKLHREDGPAFEAGNGSKEWYIDDLRHREDGPAIEWSDGTVIWCYKNVFYTFDEWCSVCQKTDEEAIVLKLMYGE